MPEGAISITKMIPIIVITWILSLVTTLAIVYVAPNIFPITVTTDNIADSAIITTKLANGTVTSAKILDGTLTAEDLSDGSIITVKVADGAVTTAKIADEAVTTGKMDDEAVTTAKIANSAIVTIKLADGSVTSAKIVDGTVTAVDLADDSIITAKIADGAVTTAKIADGAVTNLKLASGAIPYNVTHSTTSETTSSTGFVDMPDMAVNITLTRNSTLIIMFSAEAWVTGPDPADYALYVRAMVNTTQANPVSDYLIFTTSSRFSGPGEPAYESHSYTFYNPNVVAGTYPVKIQWRLWSGTTVGHVNERTLTVIALPD